MRSRFLAWCLAGWMLAPGPGHVARAGNPGPELRLPRPVVEALASPLVRVDARLRDLLLRANPWAQRLRVFETPRRFSLALEDAGGRVYRLEGVQGDAARIAAGHTGPVSRILTAPDGVAVEELAWEDGILVVRFRAEEPPPAEEVAEAPSPLTRLAERGTLSARFLGSHRYVRPVLGGVNPDNRVLDLPRQTSELEARVDATLDLGRLFLSAKPRARFTRDRWQDGPRSGDAENDEETLLLEGSARLRLHETLFVSFGRENLQWGPGQFMNPSNPFIPDNGRDNPVREVPGMDFLRLVWLPTYAWTLSWITNTGRGEGQVLGGTWRPSHALKVEWMGYEANAGFLVHGGPGQKTSLRLYGQWTASDALLLYGEGSIQKGSEALYPVDGPTPLGVELDDARSDDPALVPLVLVGGSYTLELGPTLSLEYVFNGEGYHDAEADRFFTLAHGVGRLVQAGLVEPDPDEGRTGLRLLRRHYLFAQYLHTEIADRFTVLVRWTQNLDDRSGQATGFFEWNAADRWRVFAYGAWNAGGNRDEFGSLVRYAGLVGVEFSAL